ncbi:hypothetical protein JOM56_006674 [Amanita muscaria]
MHSNTGDARVHVDGDQRLPKIKRPEKGRVELRDEYEAIEAPTKTSAIIDSDDDERAIGAKLNAIFKEASVFKEEDPEENKRTIKDPLAPALSHGNKPSRGAQIDAELKAEEEQMLRDKGKI